MRKKEHTSIKANLSKQQNKIRLAKKAKMFVAKQLWRLRQSSTILNLLFYSLTLTGIYFPYVKPFFPWKEWISMLFLSVISFIGLMTLGIIYDKIVKLWKEDNIVQAERNPYLINLFTEKELQGMRMTLSSYKASYESMRTNMLICKKLDIDCSDLEKELKKIKNNIKVYEEWIKNERITRRAEL